MASIAEGKSLFEIDTELDLLLEEIQEQIECEGQASEELTARSNSSVQPMARKWTGSAALCG